MKYLDLFKKTKLFGLKHWVLCKGGCAPGCFIYKRVETCIDTWPTTSSCNVNTGALVSASPILDRGSATDE